MVNPNRRTKVIGSMPLMPLKISSITWLTVNTFSATQRTDATNKAMITAQIRAFIPEPFIRFPLPVMISAANITAIRVPTGRSRLMALGVKPDTALEVSESAFLWIGSSSSPVVAALASAFAIGPKSFCVNASTRTRRIARIQ